MSYNLKDFAQKQSCNSENANNEKVKKQAEDLLNRYKNMSSDELASTLISEVAKQKNNGTFDKNKLLNMLDSIKDVLPNKSQYEQLRQIIMQL